MQVHRMARRILPHMSAYRRALHRMPEEGLQEHRTQAYILRELALLQPDILQPIGGTGVKCVFSGREGRSLAFRADMDALRVRENTGLSFASQHEGWMHACGHDGHMAALLGLAVCTAALRGTGRLDGNVVLLFQPAEESSGGAARLIQEGALEDPHVDEIYGLHLFPDVELGSASCRAGAMMASDYEFDIDISGKSAHIAMPQHAANALDAANALYMRLKMLPQLCDPTELALFNIGSMEGGEQRNVVPGTASIQCVLRTYGADVLHGLRERINQAVDGIACAYDVVIAIRDRVYYPAVDNPPDMAERLFDQLDGISLQKPLLIAEDFSYYQRECPGLFFFVGTGEEGRRAALHSDGFDFSDEALAYALSAHLAVLFNRLHL